MAEQANILKATSRTAGAKSVVRAVRRAGLVPGVVYGHDIEGVLVSVDPRELEEVLRTEYTYNAAFDLVIDDKDTHKVMVRDLQFDSVRRAVTHVDFKVVREDERVVIDVPVKTEGIAKGVVKGGRMDLIRRSVKVVTTVSNIPIAITQDVTALDIGDQVYIDEMEAPEGSAFQFNHRYPVIRVVRRRVIVDVEEEAADEEEGEEEEGEEEAEA